MGGERRRGIYSCSVNDIASVTWNSRFLHSSRLTGGAAIVADGFQNSLHPVARFL